MKKIFLTIAFAGMAWVANAQTSQGRLFINGTFSVSSQTVERDDDERESSLQFAPAVGYFIADRFALGLGFGLSTNRNEDTNGNTRVIASSSGFSVAPFARYYVPTANEKFQFFAQGTFAFGSSRGSVRTETPNSTITVESNPTRTLDFSISPGFAYFPSDHWALELRFRGFYIESVNPDGNDNNRTEVGLNVNSLSPSLGLSYFF